ncbi:MAG: response regulator [Deltaproteobacteria bacterium]|nr:response regulator [Deltaproteobacteria bacterium]MBN2674313.1 response regulator [Deltaproteobacteria bacterium]
MKERVIFIDDEEIFLNSLKRYFSKIENEWDTDFYQNQAQALGDLAPESKVVVVLDWSMPGMDGMTWCKHARKMAEQNGSCFHIIMLTGNEGVENTVSALEGGADDYLCKPVNLHDLKTHIELGINILQNYSA